MRQALTTEQLNALEKERDGFINGEKEYRGLVRRGLLNYRWGGNSSMGYIITRAGLNELIKAGR